MRVSLNDFGNAMLNHRSFVCNNDGPVMAASRAFVICLVSLSRDCHSFSPKPSETARALLMLRNDRGALFFLFGLGHTFGREEDILK